MLRILEGAEAVHSAPFVKVEIPAGNHVILNKQGSLKLRSFNFFFKQFRSFGHLIFNICLKCVKCYFGKNFTRKFAEKFVGYEEKTVPEWFVTLL